MVGRHIYEVAAESCIHKTESARTYQQDCTCLFETLRFFLPNEICDQGMTHLGRFIFTVGGLPSNLLKMLEVIIYSLHRIVLVQHSVVKKTK